MAFGGGAFTFHTYDPNTPALASEVNANFAALEVAALASEALISSLTTTVDALTIGLASMEESGVMGLEDYVDFDGTEPAIQSKTIGGFTGLYFTSQVQALMDNP